jgi:hypothetical protein
LRRKLQPRRLHEQSQPLEQLDEEIERSEADVEVSTEAASGGKLSRRETTTAAAEASSSNNRERWSRETAPKSCLGSRWISTARVESS